jgi:hypothetical protein
MASLKITFVLIKVSIDFKNINIVFYKQPLKVNN